VLLRELPFPQPGELYSLRTAMTDGRVTGGQVSPAEIARLNQATDVVHRAAGAFRYELSVVDQTGAPVKALTLVTLFGVGALVLAGIGIYGVMAYSVAQREGEFGVRAALGAEPGDLRMLVLKQGGAVGLIGVVIGVLTAVVAGRLVQSQLYGVAASERLAHAARLIGTHGPLCDGAGSNDAWGRLKPALTFLCAQWQRPAAAGLLSWALILASSSFAFAASRGRHWSRTSPGPFFTV
jgi:ABC-type antimicrobial peptide transport system permease subunit